MFEQMFCTAFGLLDLFNTQMTAVQVCQRTTTKPSRVNKVLHSVITKASLAKLVLTQKRHTGVEMLLFALVLLQAIVKGTLPAN